MEEIGLTPGETKYLVTGIVVASEPLKPDYKKLAAALDITNPTVAGNGFRAAIKKVNAYAVKKGLKSKGDHDGNSNGAPKIPKAPKPSMNKPKASPKKKTANVKVNEEDSDLDDGNKADVDTSTIAANTSTKKAAKAKSGQNSANGGTPAPGPKKGARKASDIDANEESGETPAAKRTKTMNKEVENEANGNGVKPKRVRKPAAPKLNEDGNPIPPKPRARKPKEASGTANGVNTGAAATKKPAAPKGNKKAKAAVEAAEAAAAMTATAEVAALHNTINNVLAGKETDILNPECFFTPINAVDALAQGCSVVIETEGNGVKCYENSISHSANGEVSELSDVVEENADAEEETEDSAKESEDYKLKLGEELEGEEV